MLDTRAGLILGIIIGGVVLFVALKFGSLGGGGAGADRKQNPVNFWLGLSITAVFEVIAIVVLVTTFIAPN